jgi:O-antigen/teichoic acid export membrane protein
MPKLRTKSASNVRWVSVSQLGRLIVQLISIALLSRLLAPSDYGLLAMALIVTAFANVMKDMGTANAIIQKQELIPKLLDTVFWFNIGLGVLLCIVIMGAAPLFAAAFREPRLRDVLLTLAIVFPVSASSLTHQTLMERASRFKSIAWVEISSSLLGFGLAMMTALWRWGVYSLVIQTVATAAASTIMFWLLSGWRPRICWDWAEFRGIWGFSGNLAAFNVINYLANNADSVLIGHFLGAAELGWYNMTFRIALVPLQNLTYVVNRALFPIYSRQNRTDLGTYYLKTLSLLALLASPVILGITSVRFPIIDVVLGEKWRPVADVLAWMGPTALLQSFLSTTGVILISTGRTDILKNCGMFSSALFIASFFAGLPFGIVGIAAAYFFATIPVFIMFFYFTLEQLNLRLSDLVKSIWRPMLLALAMSAAVISTDHWLVIGGAGSLVRLAVLVPGGAALYLALVAIFLRRSLTQLLNIALLRT